MRNKEQLAILMIMGLALVSLGMYQLGKMDAKSDFKKQFKDASITKLK